jgi:integrase
MPRPSKGLRLKLHKGKGRKPIWIIIGGKSSVSTGCDAGDREGAQTFLANYIITQHDPAKAINKSNPNASKIADVLSLEMRRIAAAAMPQHRKDELINVCANMGAWFSDHVVGDLDGDLQEQYAAERMRLVMKLVDGKRTVVATDQPAPAAAYRDLKMLAAAVNRFFKKKIGGVQTRFSPVLPDAPIPRERWLERDEAAKLIWAAWRARKNSRHSLRHIARYILVGIYTSTRHGDICAAALIPSIGSGRGYVDLDRGIFQRKPSEKKATSKRQPTVPLPPRLLAHMRRWKRLGISDHSVIEFNGKPISRLREGWEAAVGLAGLATDAKAQKVIPHTLRHTAITWYLQPDRRTGKSLDIEIVSQYCGVSVATIRKVYRHVMPGTFGPLLEASHHFGR